MKDNYIFLLEMGSKIRGGHTFHPIASHVSGINYPQFIAKFFLGDIENIKINNYKGAAYHFMYSNTAGKLTVITGLEEAKIIPGIHLCEVWKKPGDNVNLLINSTERIGCIVSLASNRKKAIKSARKAAEMIDIEIK